MIKWIWSPLINPEKHIEEAEVTDWLTEQSGGWSVSENLSKACQQDQGKISAGVNIYEEKEKICLNQFIKWKHYSYTGKLKW